MCQGEEEFLEKNNSFFPAGGEKFRRGARRFFSIGLLLVFIALIFGAGFVLGRVSAKSGYFSDLRQAFLESFEDTFGFSRRTPVFEIDLGGDGDGAILKDSGAVALENSNEVLSGKKMDQTASVIEILTEKNKGGVLSASDKTEPAKEAEVSDKKNSETDSLDDFSSNAEEVFKKDCAFDFGGVPSGKVLINEIAWMGTEASANDEWIELKNNFSGDISLAGWQLKNQSGKIAVVFDEGDVLGKEKYFLLERTDDNTVSYAPANKIYAGGLSNEGEWLRLFDNDCNLADEIDASAGWNNFGGDNVSKQTLERNLGSLGWHTSGFRNGTPGWENSKEKIEKISSDGENNDGEKITEAVAQDFNSNSEAGNSPPQDDFTSEDDSLGATVFITEIMAGSSVSGGDEFVEIYNYGSEDLDLTDWTVKKKSSSGNESVLVSKSRLEGVVIPAGGYLLLARAEGYQGGAAPDVWWPKSYALAYSNNSIIIYSSLGEAIEEVNWTEIPKDSSLERDSLDVNSGFSVTSSPNPQNSQ